MVAVSSMLYSVEQQTDMLGHAYVQFDIQSQCFRLCYFAVILLFIIVWRTTQHSEDPALLHGSEGL